MMMMMMETKLLAARCHAASILPCAQPLNKAVDATTAAATAASATAGADTAVRWAALTSSTGAVCSGIAIGFGSREVLQMGNSLVHSLLVTTVGFSPVLMSRKYRFGKLSSGSITRFSPCTARCGYATLDSNQSRPSTSLKVPSTRNTFLLIEEALKLDKNVSIV